MILSPHANIAMFVMVPRWLVHADSMRRRTGHGDGRRDWY